MAFGAINLLLEQLDHLYMFQPLLLSSNNLSQREGFRGLEVEDWRSMSNKEVEEERRLYQCARNYEKIVKQFDELIEMMNTRSRLPKRRKNSAAPAPASQHEDNEVFAQTITRFLQDLRTKPAEPDCPTAPGDGN